MPASSGKARASRSDFASSGVALDKDYDGDGNRRVSNVRIILVEPRGALNVGMVARSMANFGLRNLVLVNPQGEAADYQGEEACRMACHAVSILKGATVAPTLAAALAGVTRAVATTARQRAPPAPPLEILRSGTIGGCLDWLLENDEDCSAIIFGREDSGLTNDELSFAQRTLMIPSSPAYSSLNLSHAVTVVCYELSQQARSHRVPERLPRVPDVASTSNLLDEDVSTSRGESAILQHPHQDTEVSSPGSNNDQSVEPASVTAEESASSEMSELSTSEGSGERGMEISQLAGQLERDTCAESGARDREKSQSGQLEGARPAESPINSKLSLSEESGEWDVEIPRSEQLEREGPVESADAPNRPGWRKTRRLDRALKRTDVADGADVEGALKQAEDLLTKMGFLKGDARIAKVPKLRQLLVRASPTNSEVALLRAILRRMDWHVTKAQENEEQY